MDPLFVTALVICNRELRQICVISEAARLKSAAWTADHVLVYTTLTHMKYALPTVNGYVHEHPAVSSKPLIVLIATPGCGHASLATVS